MLDCLSNLIEGEEDSFRKAVGRGERELESRLDEMDENGLGWKWWF